MFSAIGAFLEQDKQYVQHVGQNKELRVNIKELYQKLSSLNKIHLEI